MVSGHVTSDSTSPAGLRISYAALGIIVPVLLALGGLIGAVRKYDLGEIDRAIASVRATQAADVSRLDRRLERIEDKIDRLVSP